NSDSCGSFVGPLHSTRNLAGIVGRRDRPGDWSKRLDADCPVKANASHCFDSDMRQSTCTTWRLSLKVAAEIRCNSGGIQHAQTRRQVLPELQTVSSDNENSKNRRVLLCGDVRGRGSGQGLLSERRFGESEHAPLCRGRSQGARERVGSRYQV